MEGWTQRLLTTLVLAAATLLVSFLALALGVDWRAVAVMAVALFAALVTVQLVTEMRRDVRLLKNQALELSGYESEIGRRVDYLASLVERTGGAAPDELAKRVRAVNHHHAALLARVDRLEEDVAELAIDTAASRSGADVKPRPRAQARPAPQPEAPPLAPAADTSGNGAQAPASAEPTRPAAIIPMPRPSARTRPAEPPAEGAVNGTARSPSPSQAPVERVRADDDLRVAIAGDRLAFHLEPILALPERTPVLYETLMRLRGTEGGWTESADLLERARPAGLAPLIERKTLYAAAQMLRSVRRMGKEMRLVAPLSQSFLADERGDAELRRFLDTVPDLGEALVLEVAQRDFRALHSEARERLGQVADRGFTLSLGDVRDARTDPDTLRRLGFAMARAPADFVAAAPTAGADATTLAIALASYRVELVATHVADTDTLALLIDRDVSLAQGPALSRPRLVKPDLLHVIAPRDAGASETRQAARQGAA